LDARRVDRQANRCRLFVVSFTFVYAALPIWIAGARAISAALKPFIVRGLFAFRSFINACIAAVGIFVLAREQAPLAINADPGRRYPDTDRTKKQEDSSRKQ